MEALSLKTSSREINIKSVDTTHELARIEVLVQQIPFTVLTSLFLAALSTFFLWEAVPNTFLQTWFAIVSIISLCRLISVKWLKSQIVNFDASIKDIELKKYEYICIAGSLSSGLAFGSLGYMFSMNWPLFSQFIVPFLLAGVTAGAIASNLSSRSCYYSFIVPALLPLSYTFYQQGMMVAAIMILIYLLLLVVLIKRVHYLFSDSLKLKFHNDQLVDELTSHNDELRQLLDKLHQSEQLSSGAFDEAGVAMLLVDKSLSIFRVNNEACLLLGYDKERLNGLLLFDLLSEDEQEQSRQMLLDMIDGRQDRINIKRRYIRSDGIDLWIQETISAVIGKGEFQFAIIHLQDMTQEYRLTKKLSYQANHDVLTGLLNRYAFETRMSSLLSHPQDESERPLSQHVLCYIDLDQFKVVNDTFGHMVGDEFLRRLAELLKRHTRKSDLLARLGGDEFALIMFSCSIEQAKKHLEGLLAVLREYRFEYKNSKIGSSASIGLVDFDRSSNMTDVMKQADSACYASKEAGRDRLKVYRPDDSFLQQRHGDMSWVVRIQEAISDGKFLLYSQEIVRIDGKEDLPHYELLIRMQDSEGKIIPPGVFLPAAERYNLASAIDVWVVETVLDGLISARQRGENIEGVYGINLSGQSLGDMRFYEKIIEQIKSSDLTGSNAFICFEITETAAIQNMNAALYFINELRAVHCLFALDDFGSGLSSYAYLQQMPIDFLKIDGMFVKDCLEDAVKLEMIKSINSVGHVMGLKTIAEFVENDQIFSKLGEIDVDYAQGYWNGPPTQWPFTSKV